MTTDSGSNHRKSSCGEVVRAAVRAYGSQKALAIELGWDEPTLSKFLDGQLPRFERLLATLGLEVTDAGHLEDLKRVLKQVL